MAAVITSAASLGLAAMSCAAAVADEDSTESLELAEERKTDWRGFLPAHARIGWRFACDELKKYVERMSGAKLTDTGQADPKRMR